MSEYTPTTDEVQFAAETSTFDDSTLPEGAFERWLNSVKADAWDKGYTRGFYDREKLSGDSRDASEGSTENPCRTGGAG